MFWRIYIPRGRFKPVLDSSSGMFGSHSTMYKCQRSLPTQLTSLNFLSFRIAIPRKHVVDAEDAHGSVSHYRRRAVPWSINHFSFFAFCTRVLDCLLVYQNLHRPLIPPSWKKCDLHDVEAWSDVRSSHVCSAWADRDPTTKHTDPSPPPARTPIDHLQLNLNDQQPPTLSKTSFEHLFR